MTVAPTPTGPVAVLANPTAGRGRHRELLPVLLERLRGQQREVRLLDAGTRDEACAACAAAVADGAGALVVLGGDGTVHLALQAVAGTPVPLGIVPTGTGNDFAVNIGLPEQPVPAVDTLVRALREGTTRRVDLGRLTDSTGAHRWFGAVFAAGFDAIVNERANAMRWPRGPRRYELAIFLELLRLRPRRYRLRLDGVLHELDGVLIAVGNTPSYGGGMRICPDADPTDGILDILVGGRFTRTALVRITPKVWDGSHVHHPLVTQHRAVKVEIDAEGITGYADGERVGPLPVTVVSAPGALSVLSAR